MLKNKKIPVQMIGFFLLVTLGIIWGTGYSIARYAMSSGVQPLGYSFWQSLGPAIVIGFFSWYRRPLHRLEISNVQFYLVCGLTGIVIPNTSMYFAATHLPSSILAMVVNTVPIITYPIALLLRLETFDWQRMMGILLALCGLILIILPKPSLPSADMVPWVLSTLITPFSFAICVTYIALYRPEKSDSLTLTAGMLISSSIFLIPLVAFTHQFYLFHFPFNLADKVILLEIILSSIGYLLFFQLIKIAGPVYYTFVDTIVVLTGVFWGYFLFGEQLNKWTATAVCFILFALLLVTKKQRAIHHGTRDLAQKDIQLARDDAG